jgi:uncharacterized protein involved in exopolysaccharide biosynthesis
VELNDALRRVFGQHRALILWAIVLGILLGALTHTGDSRTYTASTRFALDTEDPETQAESAAIADTAKAIATSPIQVKEAIDRARVKGRDPAKLADNEISIRALGSSGVLQLSVSDPNPKAAAALSNALAERVINARLRVSSGQLRSVLNDLSSRIASVNKRLASVDAQMDALGTTADGLPATTTDPTTGDELTALLTRRDRLTQQRTVLESERIRALSTDALRPAPSIISPATAPLNPDPSRRLPDMALGGLLGLILGTGLAALVEALRPTLVGGEALARELDTPLIGAIAHPDRPGHADDVLAVMDRLQLAARARHVESIGLVGARPGLDLDPLVEAASAHAPTPQVRPFNAQQLAVSNGGGMGLVIVSPPVLKKSELDDIVHLLRMSPAPLAGVVTYSPEEPRSIAR